MLDHLVHSFDLSIGLRVCDQQEDLLDLEVIAELLEFVAVELCTIIRYDGVGDSIPANDILVDKFLDLCERDGPKCFYLNSFSEIVDNHYCVLYTSSPFGKSAD